MTLRVFMSVTMIFFKCTVPPGLSFAFLKPFSDFPVHSEYNPNSLTWPTEPCVILFSFPPSSLVSKLHCSVFLLFRSHTYTHFPSISWCQGYCITPVCKVSPLQALTLRHQPPFFFYCQMQCAWLYSLYLDSGLLVKLPWTLESISMTSR